MNSIVLSPETYRPMTVSAFNKSKEARETITTTFRPGTKEFLEQVRRENGLRSWSDALRQIVNTARGERAMESI